MTDNNLFDISEHFKTPLATLALPQKYIVLIKQIEWVDVVASGKFTFETVSDVLLFDSYQLFQTKQFEKQYITLNYIKPLIEFKKELPVILSNAITKIEPAFEQTEKSAEIIELITTELETPLNQLPLSPQYEDLIKKISCSGGVVNTVQDNFDIDPIEFSNVPAVGETSIDLLINLQNKLQIEVAEELPSQIMLSVEQLETPLNQLALLPQHEKLIKIISGSMGVINTIQDILDIDPITFARQPFVGKSHVDLLINLQNKLQIEVAEELPPQIMLSVEQSETPLNQLILSPQYEKLIKGISRSMGVINTVQDILNIAPIEFSKLPYIGKLYVELLVSFQNEFVPAGAISEILEPIEIVAEIEELLPQITLSVEQLETQLNQLALSAQYEKLVQKISRSVGIVNTVGDILKIDPICFSKLPEIGKMYVNQLIELKKQLPDFLEKQTQKLAFFTANYSIELSEIDNILIEDIEGYLWTLNDMKMNIALSRWGFNQSHETLEEVANRHNLTRERIRQIEKPINANLPLNFRIQPKVLWANIREKMTEDLTILLPNLVKCFATEKSFYAFIELCCQVESGNISKIIFTEINPKIMNLFFCFNPSPISQEIIINELMSNYGHSKASAVNGLKQLAKNDRIEITVDGIYPKKLARAEAVAHVLTFHSSGLPWKDITRIANKKGYSSTYIDETRSTHGFSDSEYVYLSGHGTYRNLMFLDLEQFNIPEIMQNLLDYFEQRKLNALHLHDYYQQNKIQRTEIEYFTLRHIVRGYGEEYGVFFNGQSGSDSISIDKNATRITQADVVISMLNESKVAMTAQEIAERLRSKSTGHASFYLDTLMKEGRVIRVDHLVYTTPEKAFSKIDVDAVMRIIESVMNAKDTIVDADIFREYVNLELNLSYSKYIYAALVRTKLNDLGWYRNNTLFSKYPIPYKNLADMCRQFCKSELSNAENAKILQQEFWLTHSVTTDAIHQWKWQMNRAGNNLVEVE